MPLTGGVTTFGVGDATYQAMGGEAGISELVDHFYDVMAADHPALLAMHPPDNALMREKLRRFLCGWMGGPKKYQKKFGAISIPRVHAHLKVGQRERDAWLDCMQKALEKKGCGAPLIEYLMAEFFRPAEHIRLHSQ